MTDQAHSPANFGHGVASCSYEPAKGTWGAELKSSQLSKEQLVCAGKGSRFSISSQIPLGISCLAGSQITLSSEKALEWMAHHTWGKLAIKNQNAQWRQYYKVMIHVKLHHMVTVAPKVLQGNVPSFTHWSESNRAVTHTRKVWRASGPAVPKMKPNIQNLRPPQTVCLPEDLRVSSKNPYQQVDTPTSPVLKTNTDSSTAAKWPGLWFGCLTKSQDKFLLFLFVYFSCRVD